MSNKVSPCLKIKQNPYSKKPNATSDEDIPNDSKPWLGPLNLYFDKEERWKKPEKIPSVEHKPFFDNSSSFRCLKKFIVSRSSILVDPMYYFPEIDDPGIENAFEYIVPPPVHDDIGREKYIKRCKVWNIVPISRIVKNLDSEVLDLKYCGMSEKQMLALWETLSINAHVKELDIRDNWLTLKSASAFGRMLLANKCITKLNLRECRLGPEGITYIENVFDESYLTEIDLSFNSLGNKGAIFLANEIGDSQNLRVLNLSHNELDEGCCFALKKLFHTNSSIEHLDLSWNVLNTEKGCKSIFEGLQKNRSIKTLNFSWNGLSLPESAHHIGLYIKNSDVLESINLSNNSISDDALEIIRNDLLVSRNIKSINLGNNPITPSEVYNMAFILLKSSNKLTCIDMTNAFADKNILKLMKTLEDRGKKVIIGGVLGDFIIHGPVVKKVIFDRCNYLAQKPKKKKQKRNFGHFLLKILKTSLTSEEFKSLIKKSRIKLDQTLIEGLLTPYTIKKEYNKFDISEMCKTYMELYPNVELPSAVRKKKKKKKDEKKGKKTSQSKKKLKENKKKTIKSAVEYIEDLIDPQASSLEKKQERKTSTKPDVSELDKKVSKTSIKNSKIISEAIPDLESKTSIKPDKNSSELNKITSETPNLERSTSIGITASKEIIVQN